MCSNPAQTYAIDLTDPQWEEVESLAFEPFEISRDNPAMTHGQWLAIAEMAIGKSVRIRDGAYGPEDKPGDNKRWYEDLRDIAATIIAKLNQ